MKVLITRDHFGQWAATAYYRGQWYGATGTRRRAVIAAAVAGAYRYARTAAALADTFAPGFGEATA